MPAASGFANNRRRFENGLAGSVTRSPGLCVKAAFLRFSLQGRWGQGAVKTSCPTFMQLRAHMAAQACRQRSSLPDPNGVAAQAR